MGSTHKFTIKDEPVENLRPLKVRVIGAGYSGIYLGIRIPQRLRNVDLQIYEKNEGIGGTWWENRYPGEASLSFGSSPLTKLRLRLRYSFPFLSILLQSQSELVCVLCASEGNLRIPAWRCREVWGYAIR
jgi:hypothetical protein